MSNGVEQRAQITTETSKRLLLVSALAIGYMPVCRMQVREVVGHCEGSWEARDELSPAHQQYPQGCTHH